MGIKIDNTFVNYPSSKNHNTYFKKQNFSGMAVELPARKIHSFTDAIKQWKLLRHPKYSNVFQPTERFNEDTLAENKLIRERNYSFLESLTSRYDKKQFVEYFSFITGFPNLAKISQKLLQEFQKVLNYANSGSPNPSTESPILLSGYDRFCSVSLNAAWPGSDIDKGFAVVKRAKGYDYLSEQEYSSSVRGRVWNLVDNRIMGVNHYAACPNIVTDKELKMKLTEVDSTAREMINPQSARFFYFLRMNDDNPITASKFNIWLSERLKAKEEKTDAKNLAYIVETIRDGKLTDINTEYCSEIETLMSKSPFATFSNVSQNYVMEAKYSQEDMIKPKLKARQKIEKEFEYWDVDKQYRLVADIIRSMSDDEKDPEFKDAFFAKTDRHRLLLNDILCGDVLCSFKKVPQGEETHLFFNVRTAPLYHDLNVYKLD